MAGSVLFVKLRHEKELVLVRCMVDASSLDVVDDDDA
jgi:hypothetical protein